MAYYILRVSLSLDGLSSRRRRRWSLSRHALALFRLYSGWNNESSTSEDEASSCNEENHILILADT